MDNSYASPEIISVPTPIFLSFKCGINLCGVRCVFFFLASHEYPNTCNAKYGLQKHAEFQSLSVSVINTICIWVASDLFTRIVLLLHFDLISFNSSFITVLCICCTNLGWQDRNILHLSASDASSVSRTFLL